MSNAEFGSLMLFLFLLLAAARIFGYLSVRFKQPKVVGEIFAGIVIGPSLLGHWFPSLATVILPPTVAAGGAPSAAVLAFLYNFGLLLLMFVSGAETKGLFNRGDRREVAWLGIVGTGIPFVLTLCAAPFLPLGALAGSAHGRTPLLLVLSIAVAVTSIPVISKILHDLGILHTRFARLVLGVAVLEDIALWGVLAIATALAASSLVPGQQIVKHLLVTVAYFGGGLLVAPKLLRKLGTARWNILATTSPIAFVIVILFAYTAVAALLDINLAFAAFLAGFGIATESELPVGVVASISDFSFAVFIPIYFAIVGYRLDLSKTFSLEMLAVFFVASSGVKMFSAGLGARLAGFNSREAVNLATTLNARGGPGIVLASVAFDVGIINAAFYTTLVIVAVLTSQAAGAWLAYLLRTGGSLLSPQRDFGQVRVSREEPRRGPA